MAQMTTYAQWQHVGSVMRYRYKLPSPITQLELIREGSLQEGDDAPRQVFVEQQFHHTASV